MHHLQQGLNDLIKTVDTLVFVIEKIAKDQEKLRQEVEHKLGILKQPMLKENRFETLIEEIEYDYIPDTD